MKERGRNDLQVVEYRKEYRRMKKSFSRLEHNATKRIIYESGHFN